MGYRWDEFSFDSEFLLLTRKGVQITVSRRVLDCIHHLIENHHRVVTYDDLIRCIWGHGDVNNHQLSQVILAARRALGDDGHAQRFIRTNPGLGYRWVAPLIIDTSPVDASAGADACTSPGAPISYAEAPHSMTHDDTSIGQSSTEHTDAMPPHIRASNNIRRSVFENETRWRYWTAALLLGSAIVGGIYISVDDAPNPGAASPAAMIHLAPRAALAQLKARLDSGAYEEVRIGLAGLPAAVAKSPEATLLAIELDLARGRVDVAMDKIRREQERAEAAKDPLWRIRVLTLKSQIYQKHGEDPVGSVQAAQAAIGLLETLGTSAHPIEICAAFGARADALMLIGRVDEAMRDYVKARDIANSNGLHMKATLFRGKLARAWMRTGRVAEAHDELQIVLKEAIRAGDRVEQIYTLNTLSRIQSELLRWDDALATNDRALQLLREVPWSDRLRRALILRAFILSAKGNLHEARSQMEEAMHLVPNRHQISPMIIAMHHLEAGEPEAAIEPIRYSFENGPYPHDFNPMLEDVEGPLLLWTMASSAIAIKGGSAVTMPQARSDRLARPKTPTGRIALGNWLLQKGELDSAETELRLALRQTRDMGHLFRMTLAAESLTGLLLQRGDIEAAHSIVSDLRAANTTLVDRDYRSSLISLRIAIARRDAVDARHAYNQARALAGERRLPADLEHSYRTMRAGSEIAASQ